MESSMKVTKGTRTNRTGISSSSHAAQMREVSELTRPSPDHGARKKQNAAYLKESHALGTVPPPKDLKGAAKTALQALKGNKAIALVDRISERIAFERTGVRLYEAVLEKLEIDEPFKGGPARKALQQIRDEEHAHALMLAEAMEYLGADPTAMTPSADLVAVEGMGLGAVVGDPRTTVGQCLHALLIVELADGEGWTLLRTMADDLGLDDLASRFTEAEAEEERHLEQVRGWVLAHARGESGAG